MFDLFSMSGEYVPERLRKVFEKECHTYRISAKDKEYIWVVFRKVLSDSISGLYLFDVFRETGEKDPLLVEDMLKIFVAYQTLFTDSFVQKSTEARSRCEDILLHSEQEIDAQMADVQAIRETAPESVINELSNLISLMSSIVEKETRLYSFLAKYNEIVSQAQEVKDAVPAKVFSTFYLDLYDCQTIEKDVIKFRYRLSKNGRRIEDEAKSLPKEGWAILDRAARFQKDALETFFFYKQFPAMSRIVEGEFANSLVAPYRNLVRNKTKDRV